MSASVQPVLLPGSNRNLYLPYILSPNYWSCRSFILKEIQERYAGNIDPLKEALEYYESLGQRISYLQDLHRSFINKEIDLGEKDKINAVFVFVGAMMVAALAFSFFSYISPILWLRWGSALCVLTKGLIDLITIWKRPTPIQLKQSLEALSTEKIPQEVMNGIREIAKTLAKAYHEALVKVLNFNHDSASNSTLPKRLSSVPTGNLVTTMSGALILSHSASAPTSGALDSDSVEQEQLLPVPYYYQSPPLENDSPRSPRLKLGLALPQQTTPLSKDEKDKYKYYLHELDEALRCLRLLRKNLELSLPCSLPSLRVGSNEMTVGGD